MGQRKIRTKWKRSQRRKKNSNKSINKQPNKQLNNKYRKAVLLNQVHHQQLLNQRRIQTKFMQHQVLSYLG